MNETEYCSFCGSSVESDSQFCQNCGASLTKTVETTPIYTTQVVVTSDSAVYHQPATTVYIPPQKKDDSAGVLSLIFGILSIVVFPIFSIPAIILGHISFSKTKNPMAIAGFVIGYIVLAAIIGVIIWIGTMFWWY